MELPEFCQWKNYRKWKGNEYGKLQILSSESGSQSVSTVAKITVQMVQKIKFVRIIYAKKPVNEAVSGAGVASTVGSYTCLRNPLGDKA